MSYEIKEKKASSHHTFSCIRQCYSSQSVADQDLGSSVHHPCIVFINLIIIQSKIRSEGHKPVENYIDYCTST